jgi:hypothetical protein
MPFDIEKGLVTMATFLLVYARQQLVNFFQHGVATARLDDDFSEYGYHKKPRFPLKMSEPCKFPGSLEWRFLSVAINTGIAKLGFYSVSSA